MSRYNKKPRNFTKYFTANTKKKAIGLRTRWMSNHVDQIVCIRNLSPIHMIRLSHRRNNATNGYWNLYRSGKKWSARVNIRTCRPTQILLSKISPVVGLITQKMQERATRLGEKMNKHTSLRDIIRDWSIQNHMEKFRASGKAKLYLAMHPKWYYDPLVLSIDHPMMRHLRALRLSSSRLAQHSKYRAEGLSDQCSQCGCPETTVHFLLKCHKFQSQREVLIDSVNPILQKLNANLSCASLLGMFDFLESPERERQTRTERKLILTHTLRFLTDSGRFDDQ